MKRQKIFTPEFLSFAIVRYQPLVEDGERFLVKPTKSAATMMPEADMEMPYEGAKEMLLALLRKNKK